MQRIATRPLVSIGIGILLSIFIPLVHAENVYTADVKAYRYYGNVLEDRIYEWHESSDFLDDRTVLKDEFKITLSTEFQSLKYKPSAEKLASGDSLLYRDINYTYEYWPLEKMIYIYPNSENREGSLDFLDYEIIYILCRIIENSNSDTINQNYSFDLDDRSVSIKQKSESLFEFSYISNNNQVKGSCELSENGSVDMKVSVSFEEDATLLFTDTYEVTDIKQYDSSDFSGFYPKKFGRIMVTDFRVDPSLKYPVFDDLLDLNTVKKMSQDDEVYLNYMGTFN